MVRAAGFSTRQPVTQISSDVVIVGGGPAGLYAGLRLARAGWRVDLYEEHHDIGEPVHCTGVLARDAFDEFGLPDGAVGCRWRFRHNWF